jgi:hypothetical protein
LRLRVADGPPFSALLVVRRPRVDPRRPWGAKRRSW